MIDTAKLEELKSMPIEGVAERLGLTVRNHKSLCPFHTDSHPSLTYDTRRNRYRCFVCGAHGGALDLVMNHGHMGFVEACHWLANGSNVILEQWKPAAKEWQPRPFDASRYQRHISQGSLSQRARHFLFDERKLHPAVVRWCCLTSWVDRDGVEWLQIPYYDADGSLMGLQWRNLTPQVELPGGERAPRFRFPRGSRCHIYNLPVLNMLQPGEPLYITEGCSDCWAMLSSGRKAIAIPSATLLKGSDIQMLHDLHHRLGTTFGMYPDQDAPGERLFLQLRQQLPNLTRLALPNACKDYAEYYVQQQSSPRPLP